MLKSLIACLKNLLGRGPKPAMPEAETAPQSAPTLGATAPPEPTQPTPLAIPSYIAPTGEYPSSIGSGRPNVFTLAMILSAIGWSGQAPFDALSADGRQLSVEAGANAVLFSAILNQFGGEDPANSLKAVWFIESRNLDPARDQPLSASLSPREIHSG